MKIILILACLVFFQFCSNNEIVKPVKVLKLELNHVMNFHNELASSDYLFVSFTGQTFKIDSLFYVSKIFDSSWSAPIFNNSILLYPVNQTIKNIYSLELFEVDSAGIVQKEYPVIIGLKVKID